jgi:phospholipid/cholesterol/gamma-HCH transport system substrate-binding protein
MRFSKGTLLKVVGFTTASIFLTIALAFEIANVDLSKLFSDSYELEAEFENASGVFEGDAVKLAGVDIGRVTGTEIENGRAIVTFEVDGEVPLTSEARVAIRWRNVIGLRFLYVYPASSGRLLEDGDRIPISQTDSAGDIGELLNRLGPILKAIDPEKANAFLEAMNTALAGNETIVRTLLTEGSALATDLGDMDTQIKDLISSSDKIMAAYASQDRNLGKIIDDLDVVGGELATMTAEINALIENLALVQQELHQLLAENRATIDADLSYLSSLLRTLSDNRAKLARTLCTLPAGVMPYDMTSGWGEWFNVRIVKFVVKDNEGNEISSFQEEQGSRPTPGEIPDTVVCPDGTTLAKDFTGQAKASQQAATPVDIQTWLDSVTGVDGG